MNSTTPTDPKKAQGKPSYRLLLSDADLMRWYQNVQRGSEVTADVYLRRLGNFCKENRLDPKQLAFMDEGALSDLLLDNVTRLEGEGHAGNYIKSVVKALKSWLRHNRIKLTAEIKITDGDETPTLKIERVPTPAELGNILRNGFPDGKVAVSLIAFSGLRPEALGNYCGTDGLRVGDFPELTVDNETRTVSFSCAPTFIVVRAPLSKAGQQYLTLLGEEGCLYIKERLEARMRGGERLNGGSAIVKPRYANKAFIRTTNISDKVRDAIRRAGFPWRPYVLRCYFDTRLLLAEPAA